MGRPLAGFPMQTGWSVLHKPPQPQKARSLDVLFKSGVLELAATSQRWSILFRCARSFPNNLRAIFQRPVRINSTLLWVQQRDRAHFSGDARNDQQITYTAKQPRERESRRNSEADDMADPLGSIQTASCRADRCVKHHRKRYNPGKKKDIAEHVGVVQPKRPIGICEQAYPKSASGQRK